MHAFDHAVVDTYIDFDSDEPLEIRLRLHSVSYFHVFGPWRIGLDILDPIEGAVHALCNWQWKVSVEPIREWEPFHYFGYDASVLGVVIDVSHFGSDRVAVRIPLIDEQRVTPMPGVHRGVLATKRMRVLWPDVFPVLEDGKYVLPDVEVVRAR